MRIIYNEKGLSKNVNLGFNWSFFYCVFHNRDGIVGHCAGCSFNEKKEDMEKNRFLFFLFVWNRIDRNQFRYIIGNVSDLKLLTDIKLLTVRKKKGDVDGICIMYDGKTKCCI